MKLATSVFLPLLIGLFAVFDLLQRHWFANLHKADVIQLLASGICFGIALTALIDFIRKPRAR